MVSKRRRTYTPTLRVPYLFLGLCVCLLSGCTGHAAMQFYMLDAAVDSAGDAPINRFEKQVSVALGPIRLPEYLDRPQFVVAVSQNQYRLDEFHRWAERLDENIGRTLAQFLADQLGVEHVIRQPWPQKQAVDYQVGIDILEFHHAADGANKLKAQWQIKNQQQAVFNKRFDCAIPSADEPEAIVHAHSQCLGRLGMAIVTELRRVADARAGGIEGR